MCGLSPTAVARFLGRWLVRGTLVASLLVSRRVDVSASSMDVFVLELTDCMHEHFGELRESQVLVFGHLTPHE